MDTMPAPRSGSGSSLRSATSISVHSYVWYSIPALVNFSLFVSGLQRTLEVDTLWDRFWGLAFVLLAITGSALSFYLMRCTWIKSLSPQEVKHYEVHIRSLL